MRTSLVVLFVLAAALVLAGVASAAVTPLSDKSLSTVVAGHHGGGGGDEDETPALQIDVFVVDDGQQYTTALNLINAAGPVQAGNNILVVNSDGGRAKIEDSDITQKVVNVNNTECAPCDFDTVAIEVGVSSQGQQFASALSLINSGGLAQAGNNILVVSSIDKAEIEDTTICQEVINIQNQGGLPE